jgi:hypothetical protein
MPTKRNASDPMPRPPRPQGKRKAVHGDPAAEITLWDLADGDSLDFVFKLEGEVDALEVFDLVRSLQSMTVALQEANRTVNPQAPEIRVAVKPIVAGSYEIHYALSFLPEQLPLVATLGIVGLHSIAEMLGDLGVIKKAGVSVLDAIGRLRGKVTKVEEVKPNVYNVKSERGAAQVNGNVKNLLQNSVFIENLHVSLNTPANAPGVTDVRTYLASEPEASAVVVSKALADGIRQLITDGEHTPDQVNENVSKVWLNPHRGPFTDEPGQWWFKRGGGKPFVATIKDKTFLDSYGQGQPRLNSGDLLEVELLERQKISEGKLTTSYAIMRVTGYRAGVRKAELPFPRPRKRRKG